MLFNSNFNPQMYSQPMQTYQDRLNQLQTQQQQQGYAVNSNANVNNGIVWVNGLEGAKGYQLPPNNTILLMDSDSSKFYIKVTDNVGMAQLRQFEFKEIATKPNINSEEYVLKSDFDELKAKIENYGQLLSQTKSETKAETKAEKIKKE